ncbi:biotin--[acetyl-CoA-carboxylase] ligase [Peptoniphilus harei]|uniref:Bifunctional ligase/repressor BirA n=1 Tax=Peptoniphilus harei TaxID=54005 RepID=A0A2X1ZT94_9FIRM|nr:biotin--[acetyl-CoA-carboxylase] ligase [Peptoniphilus harei]MBS6535116.1 biotin--[acetyl-CoA-carboxylase] ligase [Peptoniphilus harei]MDU1643033.1 biotin--[acetyl-CoA-carboxylase] ligase [Peptoniphilus harei]MDU6744038.1 biotin--[acetyl-CoA-carboxylase] ligase [Peptoniphilus harei]QQT91555.1 biotin--[acetyl-CoA-carboxylase] ligase [Peptoniphilus harei]SPY46516.1 Bifunctional protein BirA [Peptoniphilus harei]
MKTKDIVLKELERNRASYISGQELAEKLNISRTAIWKAINNLKEEGFQIESQTKLGYKLIESDDKLSDEGIRKGLREELKDIDIIVFDEIDSTNTEAKRKLYSQDVKDFTVIVSDMQKGGRGRTGKSFASPKGSGVYFSIVLHPKDFFDFSYFDLITVKAAVSVAQGIKEATGEQAEIKWVNDLFINGKKICGILSELDADFESRSVKSVIVGIGINVNEPKDDSFKDLKDIAGYIGTDVIRNEILSSILNAFYENNYNRSDEEIIDYYKTHSLVIGKDLTFELNGKKYSAVGYDINEKGNLIVDTGEEKITLSSGEVSIKGNFYK